ncbi:tandem-95 repeat protein [Photobacterium halotolerans]|uniref:Ig-like domain-containing protein n=1 Tax=Photobacterium halotolerans TaxID=265726 RepID=UPI001372F90C|nr:Ig-like domain-containing protein [Photobacterium halotolerans]NAX48783.1 tandem-95 repeat protein [Photobacterium halotolerans]
MNNGLMMSRLATATRQFFACSDEVNVEILSLHPVKQDIKKWVATLALGLAGSQLLIAGAHAEVTQQTSSQAPASEPSAISQSASAGLEFDLNTFLAQTQNLNRSVQASKHIVGELSPVNVPNRSAQAGEAMLAAGQCYLYVCTNNNQVCSTDADCNDSDTTPPTVSISSNKTALKSGETATITFTLSESSSNFAIGDVAVTGGSLSNFTGSGTSYSATFTPDANSTAGATINIAANRFTDAAGNNNTAATQTAITVDTVLPTVTISSDKPALKQGETATITFTLSESSSDFAIGDVAVTGGSLSNFTGSGTTYSATFTPDANSIAGATVNIAADTFTDAAGNNNTAATQTAITVDTVLPTVTISSNKTALKSGETATITFTLSESSSDFTFDDVAVSGGTLSNFTGSGTTYSATFTPDANVTSGTIDIAADKFTDTAGNNNTAATQTAITVDTVLPTVTISSDKPALKQGETATITFTLSESSSDFAIGDVSVTGGSLSNFTGSGTSYSATFTPDANSTAGATINIAANTFTDAAGNGNTAATQTAITVDTVLPTVTISSDKPALKQGETATITFTLSESSSDFAIGDVAVTGGSLSNFAGSGTSYSATFTPDVNSSAGATVDVAVGVFTDAAGNTNTVASQLAISVDTVLPTVTINSDKTALKQGETATITFILSESSSDFTVGDVAVTGGSLSNFTGSGTSYSATFTPDANSIAGATVNIAADKFTDAAGNNNTAATPETITVDTVLPTVTISSDKPALKQGETATITFTLSESSSDFAIGDVAVTGGSLSNFTGSGTTYTATLSPNTDGDVTLDVASGRFTDPNGNANEAAISLVLSYDGTLPYITALSPQDDATDVSYNSNLAMTFSEAIQAGSGSLSIHDATAASTLATYNMDAAEVSISGHTLTVSPGQTFTPTHTYYVTMTNDALTDVAGNPFTGFSSETVFNFTIANAAPVAAGDEVTVAEDNLIAISVLDNDSDTDSQLNAASVTVLTAPSHGSTSINTGTGTITYTPDANFAGTDTFTYQVQDVYGAASSPATVTVTVTPVADEPVATADVGSTDEDTLVILDVLVNDSDVDSGDLLQPATLAIVTQPSHGSATVENGKIHYQPEANYEGTDTLTYTVEDSTGRVSNTATVTINVAGVNDAPVTVADTLSVNEDESGVIEVLANDSDLDGTLAPASVQVITQPQKGQTSVAADGKVTYTPAANFFGNDSFTYVVQDDLGATSQPATVTVIVASVNDAPVVVNDTATLLEDTPHTVNVLGNDQDIDGTIAANTLTIVTQPEQGSVSVDSNGTVAYTPALNFSGEDQFTYKVSDELGAESGIATVTMTVQAVNDAPVANADQVTTQEDTAVDIDLISNDSDLDGTLDLNSIQVLTPPQLGQLLDLGNGSLRYTPDAEQSGTDSFTYTISDNEADVSNTATVSVTIETVNDAPTISGTPVLSVDQDQSYEFQPVAADVESDGLTFSITNLPDWASFDAQTGRLYGVPNNDAVGSVSNIVISVTDGDKTASLPPFTLTVNNVNDAPVISGQPQDQVSEDTQYSFTPQASDIDADTLTFSIENKPVWASFNTQTGELSGTPDNSHVGTSSGIVISVSDGSESVSLAAFSISVNNVNDAPQGENLTLTLAEDTSLSIAPAMTDVDSTALSLLVTDAPLHGSLTAQGSSWLYTPSADFNGADSFNYQVTDGEAVSGIYTVSIDVTPVNDPPVIVPDSYHFKANTSGRYVLDVLSNDTDIDQDLLSLMWVTAVKGTATIQNGQAVLTTTQQGTFSLKYGASDGKGEQQTGQVTVVIESAVSRPPTIQPPADVELNATGLFTRVNLGVAKATDSQGKPLAVSLVDQTPVFQPGRHTVYWRAVDAQGNESQASQQVVLHPLITLSKDDHTTEGTTHSISVHLNGPAPDYPVTIPYTVSGSSDANDHTLLDGVLEIEQGTSAAIEFDVLNDGISEGPETLEVTLPSTLNLGSKSDYTLTISEENLAPRVSTEITQDGDSRHIVDISGGQVTVSAHVTDVNSADSHSYLWEASDSALANLSSEDEHFIFAPGALSQGVYSLKLTVTDNGTPVQSVVKHIYLEAIAQLPQLGGEDSDGDLLPDNQEGFIDSDDDGIPDYLDVTTDCNVIQEQAVVSGRYLLEGDPGVCLRKGATVAGNQMGGVQLLASEIPPDAEVKNTGGVFDFIAHGLPTAGQSYQVVLPQRLPIPANAVYRKFTESQGWKNFVTDAQNLVSSAQGEAGYCPPPGDSQWQAGLQEGHWCVQLTIQDGGPNDDDGLANGSVLDPGGVGVPLSANLSPSAVDDAVLLNRNGNTTIDVLANDTDANNDPLSVLAASVDFGVVNLMSNQIHYAAPDGFYGVATISYSISDGTGGTANAQAKVTVLNSDYPVAVDDIIQTDDKTAVVIAVLGNDTDADGDSLTVVSAVANRGSVTINTDQSLTFMPEAGYEGESIITYHIQDATGLEASAQARVTTTLSEGMVVKNRAGGAVTVLMLVLLGGLGVMRRWGGRLLALVLALISFNSQAAWFVDAELGVSEASERHTQPADTLVSQDDTDMAVSLGVGYETDHHWILTARYLDQGDGKATLKPTSAVSDDYHQSVVKATPVLTSGVALDVRYPVVSDNDFRFLVGGGVYRWEADYSSTFQGQTLSSSDWGVDPYLTAGLDYRITPAWRVGGKFNRYFIDINDVSQVTLTLSYQFGQ